MTAATNTVLGEIKLAGDLAGSVDANYPQLTPTGVTPGSYTFPALTVDGKGRITAAASATSGDFIEKMPNATESQKGVVKIGDNISVTSTVNAGYQNVIFSSLSGAGDALITVGPALYATIATNIGITTITIQNVPKTFTTLLSEINAQLSSISCSAAIAGNNISLSSTVPGATSFVEISNDNLFKYLQGYVSVGPKVYGTGESVIYVKDASVADKGVMKVGNGLSSIDGIVSIDTANLPKASESELGVVKVGAGLTVNVGTLSLNPSTVEFPYATSTTPGVVKIGGGITATSGGVITVDAVMTNATESVKGIVQVGSNINVADGVISIPTATTSVAGVVKVGSGLVVDGNGLLSLDSSVLATSTVAGLVKVGTGLMATNGVISVDTSNLPAASTSAKGAVRIGTNIAVSSGVISVPFGSTSVAGVVKIDTTKGLVIDGSGNLSFTNASILATTSQAGLVKIGANISVSNGVISVSPPNATTLSKGLVQVGDGLTVSNGVVSVPTATNSTKGLVQVGTGLSVTNGVISTNLPISSDTILGGVKIGANINIDNNGYISIPLATPSTPGIVYVGTGLDVINGFLVTDTTDLINQFNALPTATTTTLGAVKIGSGVNVTADGTISVSMPAATMTEPGVISPGNGLSVDANGVLSASIPSAGYGQFGIVQIGSGLSVSNGIVSTTSILNATTTTPGLVSIGTGLSVDSNGIVSLNLPSYAKTTEANNWTKGQQIKVSSSSPGSTITPNLELSNLLHYFMFSDLGVNTKTISFANPVATNFAGKWTVQISFYEENWETGYSSRPHIASWGSAYKFINGTPVQFPDNNTTGLKTMILEFLLPGDGNVLVKNIGTF